MNISAIIKTAEAGLKVGGKFVVKKLPTILTAVGTVGVIFGTAMAAKKAPEAKVEFEQAKAKWDSLPEDARSKPDLVWRYVKVGARYYGIVALVIGGSIACFWVANHVNLKRLAAATAGMAYYKKYAEDLEKGVKEEGGDGALSKIKDKINANSVKNAPPPNIDMSKLDSTIGECIVWDPIQRHWFISSAEQIRRARRKVMDDLGKQITSGQEWSFVPYTDFLEYAGYRDHGPDISSDAGNCLGFGFEMPTDPDFGFSEDEIEVVVSHAVGVNWTPVMYGGEVPALALKFDGRGPVYDKDIY